VHILSEKLREAKAGLNGSSMDIKYTDMTLY
jgi:hypothetical protein